MATMDHQRSKGLTPKLRFPEFVEPWRTVPLRDLAVPVSDRVGTSECIPYTVTSGVGLVSQDEKLGRTIAGKSLSSYIRLQRNDFAYNKSATKAFPEGYIARYLDDGLAAVPNSIFTCFRADPAAIDLSYLDFLFASNLHGRWLRKFLTVGARAHGSLNVNDDDLMALPVPVPGGKTAFAEQQKIAACLTSLDLLLVAEGRNLEALEAHKKGLMQQLFPRPDESRPSLRFPEFRSAPAWERKTLRRLAVQFLDGDWIESKDQSSDGVRLIQTGNVGQGFFNPKSDNARFISEETFGRLGCTEVYPGDCLISRLPDPIGRACLVPEIGSRMVTAVDCTIARFDNKQVLPSLFVAYSQTEQYLKQIAGLASGSTRSRVSRDNLSNVQVPLPDPPEQQRIADCLSALSALLAAQIRKLDSLRTHKKGLMQRLFASPEGE